MSKEFKYFILFIFVLAYPLKLVANTELPDPTRPADFEFVDDEPVFFEEIEIKEDIQWTLSAIRISNKDKTAIINGKLVRVGDEIGLAKVLEIKPLSVIINHDNRKLIVRLINSHVVKEYKVSKKTLKK
ncbi:MAG: hypothetical protein MI865_02400 [Proteobacteria bacterium]|nr:hypothetical protein [Pseudomonadota bacterium]